MAGKVVCHMLFHVATLISRSEDQFAIMCLGYFAMMPLNIVITSSMHERRPG